MSEAQRSDAAHDSETSEAKQPALTARQTALLASALLLLVVIPLKLTILAALPAVPVFAYALVSLPPSRERTLALLSSGLAFLVPAAGVLLFA